MRPRRPLADVRYAIRSTRQESFFRKFVHVSCLKEDLAVVAANGEVTSPSLRSHSDRLPFGLDPDLDFDFNLEQGLGFDYLHIQAIHRCPANQNRRNVTTLARRISGSPSGIIKVDEGDVTGVLFPSFWLMGYLVSFLTSRASKTPSGSRGRELPATSQHIRLDTHTCAEFTTPSVKTSPS